MLHAIDYARSDNPPDELLIDDDYSSWLKANQWLSGPEQWQYKRHHRFLWNESGGRCFYCARFINDRLDRCIDHVVPKRQNGPDEIWNLVPCCKSCNSSKGSSWASRWAIGLHCRLINWGVDRDIAIKHRNFVIAYVRPIEAYHLQMDRLRREAAWEAA